MSITIFASDNVNSQNYVNNEQENVREAKKNSNVIYAGNLNLDMDSVEMKKKEAQKKAWAVVSSAWEGQMSIDDSIQERRDKAEQMREIEKEANDELKQINEEMDLLKSDYNIDSESDEQKDLELIIKYNDIKKGASNEELSDEELERLGQIDMDNLTEYQNRALELYDRKEEPESRLENAKKEIVQANMEIAAIKIERLKTHPISDADKEADAILEAAGDEIMKMLRQEGIENINEKAQEANEDAEKKAEEKEEREEALQKAKEENNKEAEAETDLSDLLMNTLNQTAGSAEKSLDEIKNSMALLEADLMGIKVDTVV